MNNSSQSNIHSSAKIHESAKIGPFVTIEQNVEIGAGSVIESHAFIGKNTKLGKGNYIGPFTSLGGASQSKYDNFDDESGLEVGDNNKFHEYCCINRGSLTSNQVTKIGDNNVFMAFTHVGHDCVIGNNSVMVNQATLAGHVIIGNNVTLGYSVAVRQFCQVGDGAFVSECATVVKDIMPFVIVRGAPTRVVGINKVGLERLQVPEPEMALIKECFRAVFRRNLLVEEAVKHIETLADSTRKATILDFLAGSNRGIVR